MRAPTYLAYLFVASAAAAGCSGPRPATDAGADAGPPAIRTTPPNAPMEDDPNFQVTARRWLMAGDPLTPRDALVDVVVTAPAGTRVVDAWIDATPGVRLEARADGTFHVSLDAPAAGDHTLLLAADGSATAFAARPLHVSAALYSVVSVDWDDSDPGTPNLTRMETLRAHHAHLAYTQFLGPYVLTDPATTPARKQELLAWVLRQRTAGDEIGLHIHPRCSFVDTTTVPCRAMPSCVYPEGDPTGYTVILAAYTTDEQTTLFQASADLFVRNGLARPVSFRAGGWTAGLNTLDALQRAGYTVDSSALPPESIQHAWGAYELGRWTTMNWTGITPTSQPYHPSRSNIVAPDPAPAFSVLEVPDNGTLVDYMLGPAMITVLRQNWPDPAVSLLAPRVFQIGLHPGSYSASFHARMETALTEVDLHLYADDTGPIVYARLGDLTRVWP